MFGNVSLLFIGGVFVASVAVVVGLGLFVITVVLEMQHRHRKRLSRVGRKRLSGRIDIDEARMMLVRQKQDTGIMVKVADALSRVVPLLNTARLRANIHRAALNLSIGAFVMISLAVGALVTVAMSFLGGYPLALVAAPGLFAGMVIVDRLVRLRGSMLASKFMKQLPDALDTIIRGIRSGLPVIETIGAVGDEFGDPVGRHFRDISERVKLGESLDQALWSVARIIDRPEMDFLAVSISIQMETGGSLAEALGNLGDLLRQRQRMKLKIKAISSEAKASALIIGALPFVMLALLSFMSPDYVWPLFTDERGQMMLMAGCGSIGVGAFVMWRMTQFDI